MNEWKWAAGNWVANVEKQKQEEKDKKWGGNWKSAISSIKRIDETEKPLIFSGGIYPEDDIYRLSEQLLQIIEFYDQFEIDDVSGTSLTQQEVLQWHFNDHNMLRRICWQHDNEALKALWLSHVGEVQTRPDLKKVFSKMPYDLLKDICNDLCYLDVSKDKIMSELDEIVKE